MYIPGTTRLHIPLAHPSCSYYYLLSPNILFLHILFVLHFLFYCTFYSLFLFFFTYIYALVLLLLYNFYFYSFALSTEWTWFDYISLLIIPCIIYYVMNKETLNLSIHPSIHPSIHLLPDKKLYVMCIYIILYSISHVFYTMFVYIYIIVSPLSATSVFWTIFGQFDFFYTHVSYQNDLWECFCSTWVFDFLWGKVPCIEINK